MNRMEVENKIREKKRKKTEIWRPFEVSQESKSEVKVTTEPEKGEKEKNTHVATEAEKGEKEKNTYVATEAEEGEEEKNS